MAMTPLATIPVYFRWSCLNWFMRHSEGSSLTPKYILLARVIPSAWSYLKVHSIIDTPRTRISCCTGLLWSMLAICTTKLRWCAPAYSIGGGHRHNFSLSAYMVSLSALNCSGSLPISKTLYLLGSRHTHSFWSRASTSPWCLKQWLHWGECSNHLWQEQLSEYIKRGYSLIKCSQLNPSASHNTLHVSSCLATAVWHPIVMVQDVNNER